MAVVAVDANVLVGLLDKRDKWHAAAVVLCGCLERIKASIVYFDCVVNESISVLFSG